MFKHIMFAAWFVWGLVLICVSGKKIDKIQFICVWVALLASYLMK